MIKYCLPIIKESKSEVIDLIEQNESRFQMFEVWLDYIEDLTTAFIVKLAVTYEQRLILVFRRQKLGAMKLPRAFRHEALKSIFSRKSYVDIDLESQKEDLEFLASRPKAPPIICSYHNYDFTPQDAKLSGVISRMEPFKPAVFKIATYCKEKEDALRLLKLLITLKGQGKRAIILGMGEYGVPTRIFGTLWGNELIFAPLDSKAASAPGQLTLPQLTAIFRELEPKRVDMKPLNPPS